MFDDFSDNKFFELTNLKIVYIKNNLVLSKLLLIYIVFIMVGIWEHVVKLPIYNDCDKVGRIIVGITVGLILRKNVLVIVKIFKYILYI